MDPTRAGKLGVAASSSAGGPPMVPLTPELAMRKADDAPKAQQFSAGQIAGTALDLPAPRVALWRGRGWSSPPTVRSAWY